MRPKSISSHVMKKAILYFFVLLAVPSLIFFITGFIFYTPPKSKSLHDSMTMRIERIPHDISSLIEGKEREREKKENEQLSSAAEQLPRLNERLGNVRVSTRYEGLLAQMGSILIGSVQASDVVEGRWKELMSRNDNDPANEGMPAGSPLGAVIRERMGIIEDVLQYASSQAEITIDLLAAVAWAESKMLPYALNVEGKAYYFTSREQALKALRGIETDNVDIGLFQVNYRLWGEPMGLKKEDLLNSKVCAFIGAMILKYNLQRHKDPWVAVGRYHSGDMDRMRAYQAKVSHGLMIIRALPLISRESEGAESSGTFRERKRDPAFHSKGISDS